LLKSVISPLEEEISSLKAQLDDARTAANLKACSFYFYLLIYLLTLQ